MLIFYVEAPFAACRTFTAGWYRPSATFLTPSAAYGLLLNLAGIETRQGRERIALRQSPRYPHPIRTAACEAGGRGADSPACGRRIEGIPEPDRYPNVHTVYQQLHNYPVGSSGGERAASTFGNKYNITPVRRELLVGLRTVVVIDGNDDLEHCIRLGLSGELSSGRYGLPFVGDNSFLPDRIEPLDHVPEAHWYERVAKEQSSVRHGRLVSRSGSIGRLSQTTSDLYAIGSNR